MDTSTLVQRYVAIWNEPDENARRSRVAELWAQDGAHYASTVEARGHAAIAERIARTFDRFVKPGEFRFRALDTVDAHHNSLKFNWAMYPVAGGMAQMVGFDFFLLDENGLIRADYQFIEP